MNQSLLTTPRTRQPYAAASHEQSLAVRAVVAGESKPPPPASTASYTVLVVDRNDYIRDSLISYLQNYHLATLPSAKTSTAVEPLTLHGARTITEAQSLLQDALSQNGATGKQTGVDLLIVDLHLLVQAPGDLMGWLAEHSPHTRVALSTAYQIDEDIAEIKRLGVTTVITKTVPFCFDELSLIIDNLRHPERAFGLQRYLGPTLDPTEMIIRSSEDIMQVFMALQGFFITQEITNLHDLCTALIEAVTNAVYHAIAGEDGNDKYFKGQEIAELLPGETVTISYGANEAGMGVSILDQGGRLKPDQILYWLERNMSGDNLMDTHGRGIFLIYTLCDRLIINVTPGQKTELLMLNYKHTTTKAVSANRQVNKPIYIHVSPAAD